MYHPMYLNKLIDTQSCMQGWLKAQAGKATALGLKALKASKKFNMLKVLGRQRLKKNLICFRSQGLKKFNTYILL